MKKNGYTRRQFMRVMGLGAAATAMPAYAAPQAGGTPAVKTKPNILFIISDEHNAQIMGCAGNPIVRTPNLDALAARGVVFENAYCNSPLCVPSRLSFTSGKYVSRVGAWSNNCWLPRADYPSLPRLLNTAGYESILCGKMHYDRTRRYGFTEIGGNMNASVKRGTGERRKPGDLEPTPGISGRFDAFHAGDTSGVMKHDQQVTQGAAEFLRERKASKPPFFLLAGYLAPHFPLIVPEKYWEPYRGKVPMPVIPEGYLESLPRNYKHLRIGFNIEDVPSDIVRKGRELYYGFVQWLDNEIGQLLEALADSEAADNTLVIYTTDHGENMGEHGLWWKNNLLDSAAHIPLIVSWPARWTGGQRRTGVCSLVDVVQTLAEIAEATPPADWDGDSMAAWLDDPNAAWKDRAVSEYYGHNIASGNVMIRMGNFKYIYHISPGEGWPVERELYNLQADPSELENLAGRPEYAGRVAKMHAALLEELGEAPSKIEARCRADYARGYDRAGAGLKNKPRRAIKNS